MLGEHGEIGAMQRAALDYLEQVPSASSLGAHALALARKHAQRHSEHRREYWTGQVGEMLQGGARGGFAWISAPLKRVAPPAPQPCQQMISVAARPWLRLWRVPSPWPVIQLAGHGLTSSFTSSKVL